MRFLVYETSWVRNLQYDIEGIFKTCEDVDPLKDLQDWLNYNKRIDVDSQLKLENFIASDNGSSNPTTPGGSSRARSASTLAESEVYVFIPYSDLVPTSSAPVPPEPARPLPTHM